ncbi:MAG: tetratricopeptide repeat protein [Fibromonadales bacterium]|nr:tetratricopeptide repeat protein [Fibromonadales bacterium]
MKKVLTILLFLYVSLFFAVLINTVLGIFFYIPKLCSGLNPAQTLYDQGTAYADKGDYDKAIEDYTSAIEIINNNLYKALNDRGEAYTDKGDYDRAIEDYNAALKIKPDNFFTLNDRGYAYYKKGDYDQAIENFEAVLKIDPDNTEAREELRKIRALKSFRSK